MKKMIKKIYNKLDDKFHFGQSSGMKVFHLLDIGKINGNIVFSLINWYYKPQSAPWVLLGIGYEHKPVKEYTGKPGELWIGSYVFTFWGYQKRINRVIKVK